MATAHLTSTPANAEHPASMSPADTAAHQAASHVTLAPVVDVVGILMTTAALLREYPRRILNDVTLVATVLEAAGPDLTETHLRPVWEALPVNPDGDEYGEYASRLVLAARSWR